MSRLKYRPCQHFATGHTLILSFCLYDCCVCQHAHREPKPFAGISSSSRPNALRVLLGASGWAAYFHQSTLLPGLALALLYLSVLSLGSLMTSYLAWQGLSEATLSLFRAVGALSGLLATVVFPPLQHCGVGLVGAGALGISWQVGV
jgi:iron-regulated transporter 1